MVAAGVSGVYSNGRVWFQIRNIDWALRGQYILKKIIIFFKIQIKFMKSINI